MRFTHDGPLFCTAFRHLGQSPKRKELLMDADTIIAICAMFSVIIAFVVALQRAESDFGSSVTVSMQKRR